MRVSLGNKILGGFIAVAALLGLIGWLSISNQETLNQHVDNMYQNELQMVRTVGDVTDQMQVQRISLVCQTCHQQGMDQFKTQMTNADARVDAGIQTLQKFKVSKEEASEIQDLKSALADYRTNREQVLALARDGKLVEAQRALMTEETQKWQVMKNSLDGLAQSSDQAAKASWEASSQSFLVTRNITIGATLFALLAGLSFGFWISHNISRRVGQVAQAANRIDHGLSRMVESVNAIAKGDLTSQVEIAVDELDDMGADEVGDMARCFNAVIDKLRATGQAFSEMTLQLRSMIQQVAGSASTVAGQSEQLSHTSVAARSATEQIAATMQQIAKGAYEQASSIAATRDSSEKLADDIDQIADGADQQAAAVDRVSTVVLEMNESLRAVADNSQAVATRSAEAAQSARMGSKAVEETVQGMASIRNTVAVSAAQIKELGKRSGEIGGIIEVIDDIAEQTNLLALNAAIEAARAGEHGKGFAVVADEVRKLAERSGKATKEIAGLIAAVQEDTRRAVEAMDRGAAEVDHGVHLTENAGEALGQIQRAVEATDRQIQQISAAAEKMFQLGAQVAEAMAGVSKVATSNITASKGMSEHTQAVLAAMRDAASISEQNSAAAEEVSAFTEEVGNNVQEVVNAAKALAGMAEELKQAIGHFKTGEQYRTASEEHPSGQAPRPIREVRRTLTPLAASR